MSLVPFETQIDHKPSVQCSQESITVVFVHHDQMTERQGDLMKRCYDLLSHTLRIRIIQMRDLLDESPQMKHFVIPSYSRELIRTLKRVFDRPTIHLPRAVIEARTYHNDELPIRTLAISLSMVRCKIFLVKSLDLPSIRDKIHEMSGSFRGNFNDPDLNILVTDTADNKYCSRAIKQDITVVKKSWVDEHYDNALEEDSSNFNVDAFNCRDQYKIKPFYGIQFRLLVNSQEIKQLIIDNEGDVIYGNANPSAYTVVPDGHDTFDNDRRVQASHQKPRFVTKEFLDCCVKAGYYLNRKEFEEFRNANKQVIVKKETPSQSDILGSCVFTPPRLPRNDRILRPVEPWADLPPPQMPLAPRQNLPKQQQMLQHMSQLHQQQQQQRQNQCQSDPVMITNDMIMKALSEFETAQTQQASSQMRRLPDQELKIEQTYEPSQQLFWNDVPRRN